MRCHHTRDNQNRRYTNPDGDRSGQTRYCRRETANFENLGKPSAETMTDGEAYEPHYEDKLDIPCADELTEHFINADTFGSFHWPDISGEKPP